MSREDVEVNFQSYSGETIKLQPVPTASVFNSNYKTKTTNHISKRASTATGSANQQEFAAKALEPKVNNLNLSN